MKLALIGENVSNSKSKFIHEKLIDCNYDLLSCDSIDSVIDILKKEYNGFNVTIPYKEAILPYLDDVDKSADIIKSCNTVTVINGRLKGYNTDMYGFLRLLDNMPVKDKDVLVLGAGGAAKGVLKVLSELGCKIEIYNRTKSHAEETIQILNIFAKTVEKEVCFSKKYDIIVNTTSVGMHDEYTPYPVCENNAPSLAIDIICKQTAFLKEAKQFGAITLDGYKMLVYQALQADEIYIGKQVPEEKARKVLEELI